MQKALVAIAILVLIAPGAFADDEYDFDKKDSFDGAKVKDVVIDVPFGEISLVKSQGNKIDINYQSSVTAEDRKEADDIFKEMDYRAELSGDRLEISVEIPRHERNRRGLFNHLFDGNNSRNTYIALEVGLPDGKAVEISTASADVDASNLKLDLDIGGASSDIDIKNIQGSFSCKVASGDVDIAGHQGEVYINGVSSDIRVIDIKGDLDISSISGLISVESADGSVKANSVSGDIRLRDLTAPEGVFDAETVSGDISIEVGDAFAGRVVAKASHGDIDTHFSSKFVVDDRRDSSSRSRIRGRVGDGNGRLSALTTSGDIDIGGN